MKPLQRQPGGSNPRALWTDEEADSLRKSLKDRLTKEKVTYRKLGEELHCSPQTVWSLVNKQRYRDR